MSNKYNSAYQGMVALQKLQFANHIMTVAFVSAFAVGAMMKFTGMLSFNF